MKLLKIIIAAILSVALGLVFIYSGYTKLTPVIETFEFTFVDIGCIFKRLAGDVQL